MNLRSQAIVPDNDQAGKWDAESARLMASATNYLSASAYLLRAAPAVMERDPRRIERVALLAREAVGIIDLLQRRAA